MILTITLNPSVDRTVSVPELVVGEVNVISFVRDDPGGKGVNVSRALTAQGFETTAIIVGGGDQATWLENQLHKHNVQTVMINVADRIRTNLTVMDNEGRTTKLNERGPELDISVLDRIEQEISSRVKPGDWVVMAGRLPRGLPDDSYARLVRVAHANGAKAAVDSDGASLASAVAAGPDLIKPNVHELSGLVGGPLKSFGDVVRSSRTLREKGVGAVLCSMGPDGALYIGEEIAHVAPTADIAGSTVGAGDTLLAGFLANGANASALEAAVQWSAAAIRLPGTGVPTTAQAKVEPVVVSTEVTLDRSVTA